MSVVIDDGLPQHVCMKCIGQAETLEKTSFLSYTERIAVTCAGLGLIPWFSVHSSAYFSALLVRWLSEIIVTGWIKAPNLA